MLVVSLGKAIVIQNRTVSSTPGPGPIPFARTITRLTGTSRTHYMKGALNGALAMW